MTKIILTIVIGYLLGSISTGVVISKYFAKTDIRTQGSGIRAVHKYKDSREQFEMRTHKRLIDIIKPSQKVVDALMSVELPAGVEFEVKI